jgi:hypothetical protein
MYDGQILFIFWFLDLRDERENYWKNKESERKLLVLLFFYSKKYDFNVNGLYSRR